MTSYWKKNPLSTLALGLCLCVFLTGIGLGGLLVDEITLLYNNGIIALKPDYMYSFILGCGCAGLFAVLLIYAKFLKDKRTRSGGVEDEPVIDH